jgi:2-polyprenyl-3-methyl-5-hydroxy-6-metoxy-1,4-benzoquinol methylase
MNGALPRTLIARDILAAHAHHARVTSIRNSKSILYLLPPPATLSAMRCTDAVTHYTRDAEEFDYFAPLSALDADVTRRLREAVLRRADLRPGLRVLDIGAGDGWLGCAAAGRGCTAVAVDLGLRNLHRLRESGNAHRFLVCAAAERLPFRSGSFHRVVAAEVLEHCNDPAAVLAGVRPLLAGGGRLLVSTPYRETLRLSLCIHCNKPTPANAHLHSFDEASHAAQFAAAGLPRPRARLLLSRLLVASRLSSLLRFLPHGLWRLADAFCMFVGSRATMIVLDAALPPRTDTAP